MIHASVGIKAKHGGPFRKLAKEFVSGFMSELRPELEKQWPHNPKLYKVASADFDFAEKTLLKIATPLLDRDFGKVCDLVEEYD